MDDSAVWAVIWLAATAAFGIGEMTMAGSFFLLPFAVGSLAAAITALLGASAIISLPVFLIVSLGVFLGLRPVARRLDLTTPEIAGIGANRLIGGTGSVIQDISPMSGNSGMVRVGTEEWNADGVTEVGMPIGTKIRVLEVRGTRLVVEADGLSDLQEFT